MKIDKLIPVARSIAFLSKDRVKVGAIICSDDGAIVSTGFNGFPRGICDYDDRINNEEVRLKYIVHAEANAIIQAGRLGTNVIGKNLIVWGRAICSECTKFAIQAGISKIYTPSVIAGSSLKWTIHRINSRALCKEAGVIVIEYNQNDIF